MGGSFKWPSVSEVIEYRQKVRKAILDVIDTVPLKLPVTQDDPLVSQWCQLDMLAVSVVSRHCASYVSQYMLVRLLIRSSQHDRMAGHILHH